MGSSEARKRTRAEIAFTLLRTLATGLALWGGAGALSVAGLCVVLHADEGQVEGALHGLTDEGMILVDDRGTVQLTEQALRDLLPSHSTSAMLM